MISVPMLRLVSTPSNTCMNSAGTSISRFSTKLKPAARTKYGE